MYGSVITIRNHCFDKGFLSIVKATVPVISIGNLAVGGTGKTPFTLMLARIMREQNIPVSLLSSGYGRSSIGEIIVVSQGILKPEITPKDAGDEVYMHALTGLYETIIANKPKYKSIDHFSSPILIDDGFQHRKIARDIDIVLVSKKDLTDSLLPFGRMREPLASLIRSDIIVCTDDAPREAFAPYMKSSAMFCRTASLMKAPYSLDEYGAPVHEYSHCEIANPVMAIAGIANPERFLNSLTKNDIKVAHHHWLKDHAHYDASMIEQLCDEAIEHQCSTIVITSKDAVKLQAYSSHFASKGIRVLGIPIIYECIEGKEELISRIIRLCSPFIKSI
jgi:tetraacyldisaccharide 4'-kinase